MYLSPGDNEYNDCPNPESAWALWEEYLGEYDQKYWPRPTEYKVVRQPNRTENFAFVFRKTLFVGLNLVGGIVHDTAEWAKRLGENLEWVDTNVAQNKLNMEVLVLFGHAGTENYRTVDFYEPLKRRIRDEYKIPTLVTRKSNPSFVGESNSNGVEDKIQDMIEGVPGYMNVHVDVGVWPPTRITIDSEVKTFYAEVDQRIR